MASHMPGRKAILLILSPLLLLLGCGGSGSSGGSNGMDILPPVPFTELLVVTDNPGSAFSGTVLTFGIGSTTGALTPGSGSPFGAGVQPRYVAFSPNNHFLYVSNLGTGSGGPTPPETSLSAYSVNVATGTLTLLAGSPITINGCPHGLAINPAGTFLYMADLCNRTVIAFSINGSTGALTPLPGSPFPAGFGPVSMAIDSAGKFLYVTDVGSNTLLGFAIQSDGSLMAVPGSPFPVGTDPEWVTVASGSNLVYVSNAKSNDISAFTFDATGALTAVAGSPFADPGPIGGALPEGLVTSPSGNLLFVANEFGNSVAVFSVAGGGALTPVAGSPFALPGFNKDPFAVAIDAPGKFLYVTLVGSNELAGFSVSSGGSLTPLPGSPFPESPTPQVVATSH